MQVEVNRKNFTDIKTVSVPSSALASGQVRLKIDAFSLTANNVTYAAVGDMIGYWKFYEASLDGYGMVPVWGFADVVESRSDDIAVGSRFYGYYPMAEDVVMEPIRISEHGFTDGMAHRQPLPVIYNQYIACATDPLYDAALEPMIMLIRPLFTTSFLIDDFCAEEGFFGADQMLITSASSKTSFALAEVTRHRSERPKLIGLTSPRNIDFVKGLGFYDEVVSYSDIPTLDAGQKSFYVDMAGSHDLREAIHTHFGENLSYACAVGAAHWDKMAMPGGAKSLSGPTPQMFFAPGQAEKRIKELGREEFGKRIGLAWGRFLPLMGDRLAITTITGGNAIAQAFSSLVDGSADPKTGIIASV